MGVGIMIVYIKTDDIYKDSEKEFETKFDASNYELDRPLCKGKHKNVIGLMKDKLGRKNLLDLEWKLVVT